jgi:hypothetical protein
MNTVKAKISVGASVGSALMFSAAQIMSSDATVSLSYNFVSNSSAVFLDSSKIQTSSLFLGSIVHQKWGAEANLRFKELASKDVMDELTAREWAELDSLSALRREAKFPLSADQILWQRKQNALTDKLLSALKEYVEFHNISS